MSDHKQLRRTYGPRTEEEIRRRRKLEGEEISNLHSSPNITIMTRSRRVRYVLRVAVLDEMRNVYKILVTNLNGRYNLEKFLRIDNDVKIDLTT